MDHDGVNSICNSVICDIYKNSNNNWIYLDVIILSCLQRLQVPCFEVLGFSVSSLPSLSLIISMHNDIDVYIRTYTAIKNIVTLHDLEHDLIQYLKSRCYPTMALSSPTSSSSSSKSSIMCNDPNEIKIDTTDEHISRKQKLTHDNTVNDISNKKSRIINCFDDYGIGRLCSHPIIMQIFQLNHHSNDESDGDNCCRCYSIKSDTDLLNTNDIIQFLISYMRENNFNDKEDDNNSDDDDDEAAFTKTFIDYLNQQLTPLSITDYGVFIQGNLSREKLIAQNILNTENKLMIDIKRKELEKYKHNDSSGNMNSNTGISNGQFSIKLKCPDRLVIQGFLDSVKSHRDEGKSSSKSRTKILQAVQSHIDSSSQSNEEKELIRTELIEIAVEYAMLHLGKSSYRKKVIDVNGIVNINNGSILPTETRDHEIGNDTISHNFETNRYMNNDIYNNNFTKLNRFKGTLSNCNDNRMGILIIPPEELASCIPIDNSFDTNDTYSIGRWGESLVYQYLVLKENKSTVTWMNLDTETRASYDITVITPTNDNREITTYIEVKSTRYPYNNVFELSLWEWEFATKMPSVKFNIYRVFNVGDPKTVRIAIITDVLRMITEGSIKLCVAI